MDSKDDSPVSPDDSTAIKNGDKDEESCILVEENISIVDLADDTIQDQPGSELCNDSTAETDELIDDAVDVIPAEFQVIDEVGGSQEIYESEQEVDGQVEEGEINGVSFMLEVLKLN